MTNSQLTSNEHKERQPQMDWQQVVLNGGRPCFFVEGPQYCGRAERWPGHGNEAFHDYVSLNDLLTRTATATRDKCLGAIKSLRATPHGAAYNNAINDAIHKVESLTLDQVEQKQ